MRPAVITFYSYKGGVGRTLLAANMAVALARRGKTLLWDLDVEAPGLHRISALRNVAPVKAGFFDWLIEWQKNQSPPLGAADFKRFDALLYPTSFSDLAILPAHSDEANPAALYFAIDWAKLLGVDPPPGKQLLDDLLDHLGELGYQHVLLDSRTGLTDLGGLLAGVLPDATVLVGGYGKQNMYGLRNVRKAFLLDSPAKKVLRGGKGLLKLFPVASPIPQNDTKLVEAGKKIWADAFEIELNAIHEICFDRELPFSEDLFIRQPEKAVAKDYEKFASALSDFVDTLFSDRQAAQNQIDERPDIFDRDDFDPRDPRKSRAAQGKRFEERVADLLRLLGYSVEPEQVIDSNRVDLLARIDSGLDQLTYFVECKDHQAAIGQDVVDKLGIWLTKPQAREMNARGMVVANAFSPTALKSAKDLNINALTPTDLERRLLDFDRYLATEIADFEGLSLATSYVTQRANSGKEAIDDLEAHGLQWANGTGSRLWVLLGDYGTGKTAYTRKLSYELAKLAKNDSNAPVPLRISLREFPNKVTLDDLVAERWLQATGQRKDPRVLLHLVQRGRIVLLFDAFDEMGIATAGRSVVDQFRMLVRIAGQAGEGGNGLAGNRVLVTCREQFFKDHGDAINTAAGRDDRIPESQLEGITKSFDGTIDTVAPFDAQQIEFFLTKRLGFVEGLKALQFLKDQNLLSLGDRPQLLDIIIASLPDLQLKQASTGAAINVGGLYQTYTNQWLDNFKPTERQSTSSVLRAVLEELAHSLWQRQGNRMHYGDLFALFKDRIDLRGKLDPNQLDVELRTAAFLSRTPDGMYGFSHRSFLEYFLARHIERAACSDHAQALANVLAIPRLSREVCSFVHDLVPQQDASRREALRRAVRSLLADAPSLLPLAARVNALILGHHLNQHSPGAASYIPPAAALAGADLSELNLAGLQAPAIDLQGARLVATNLSQANLLGALLQSANLTQAVLTEANLSQAQLQNTDATECIAARALFICASAQKSTWFEAQMQASNLVDSDFTDADLRLAQLAGVTGQPVLHNALLFGATAPGATGLAHTTPQLTRPALTRLQLARSAHHFGTVRALAYSPDGRTLASGGDDKVVGVWDARSGKALKWLESQQGALYSINYSPDGKTLASGGQSGTVQLLDADSGKVFKTLLGHIGAVISIAFSPDGKTIASGGHDRVVRLWDAHSGLALNVLEGHQFEITSIAYSPDGKILASGGHDRTVRLWDVQSGTILNTLQGDQGAVSSVAYTPDGKTLAGAGQDGAIQLWDVQSGVATKTLVGHQGWVAGIAYSPDGKTLASIGDDKVIRLWDTQSTKARTTLEGHRGSGTSIAYSPDGKTLASAGCDAALRLWDAQVGTARKTLEGHHGTIYTIACSPDGKTLASGGFDGAVRLWQTQSGKAHKTLVNHIGAVSSISYSPDGKTLASGGHDSTLRLWDLQSGKSIATLQGHTGAVISIAYSPDGKTLASGGGDKFVRLWDAQSGRVLNTFDGNELGVTCIAFSPDGKTLASGGYDKTVRVWDARSGKALKTLERHHFPVSCIAYSPDGATLASGAQDGYLRLWDAHNDKSPKVLEGHRSGITSIAFSPDGKTLASAGDDETVRLWNPRSGRTRIKLENYQFPIRSIAYSADGKTLISLSSEGTLRFWACGKSLAAGIERLQLFCGWSADGGANWLSLDFRTDPRGLWRGAGPLLDSLQYRDMGEAPQPWPWLPRDWYAVDLPELKAPD